MKKFVAILLLLTMVCGALFACKNDGPKDETGATLEAAVEYLTSTYKADEGKATQADYKLIAQIPIGDVKFEVTWTVDNDSITITLADGLYNVDVPEKNETETPYTLTATVKDAAGKTATKTFTRILPVYDNSTAVSGDDIKENTAYKIFFYQGNLGKNLFLIGETDKDKFLKTTEDPKAALDFYAEKVEGGYKFYATIGGEKKYIHAYTTTGEDDKVSKFLTYATESDAVYYYKTELRTWFVKINNIEYGLGTYNEYNTASISEGTYFKDTAIGTTQFPLTLIDKAAGEAMLPSEGPKDPTEITSIDKILEIAGKLADGASTPEKYLVSGKISEIVKADYGNLYIEDEKGTKIYVYGTYSKDGETRFDAMNPQPKVGDTIVVKGILSNYKGTLQLKNVWVQSINGVDYVPADKPTDPGDDQPTDPADITAVLPEAGKNYKLFFVQKNLDNAVYYMTGKLDGYYMGSTQKVAEGAIFTLEAVEGGYSLVSYADGAKKYVNVVKSGDHTNAKYEDTATTVWTIDETMKTVKATISDGTYVLGTKADKQYKTLGPEKADSGCMYAQFVATTETPSTTPSTPGDDNNKPAENTAVLPEAGKSYKLYFVQKNLDNKILYMTGKLDGYYMGSTETAADGAVFAIEAVEGGYSLYCTVDGAKKYVNIVKSGNYTNAKYEDAATTVWTIDETMKTVKATISDGTYVLGTKADKQYKTLGPEKADSGCMYAQFVLADAAAETPSTPSNPDEGGNTGNTGSTEGVTEVKVDTAYYIEGKDGNGALYFDGTLKSGRINGVRDAASAKVVYLEAGAAAGEYYIYFMDGSAKKYIGMDSGANSKTAAFIISDEKTDDCVFLITNEAAGIFAKNLNNRGIGTKAEETKYNNFSSYSGTNLGSDEYDFAWFSAAKA